MPEIIINDVSPGLEFTTFEGTIDGVAFDFTARFTCDEWDESEYRVSGHIPSSQREEIYDYIATNGYLDATTKARLNAEEAFADQVAEEVREYIAAKKFPLEKYVSTADREPLRAKDSTIIVETLDYLKKVFEREGISAEDQKEALANALDSRMYDLPIHSRY